MPNYGASYSTGPHGESRYGEWFECEHCGYRWSVDRPQDKDKYECIRHIDSYEWAYPLEDECPDEHEG